MPQPIRTPRVNNNDDVVKLSHIFVDIGARIRPGDPILDVETDKATFTVESEAEGYLLAVNAQLGEMVSVGSVIAWLGATPDEKVETASAAGATNGNGHQEPTLKALLLLKQYGLRADQVPHTGLQLTADDVRRFASSSPPRTAAAAAPAEAPLPTAPGTAVTLSGEERGMLRTVRWQHEQASPAYLDIAYDPEPWRAYASAFQQEHGLWFDPQLSLLSWRLAQLARENPRINATIAGADAWHYDSVNLGFTMQAGKNLFLVVVKGAGEMDEKTFVRELGELQMSAMRHSLTPDQTSDATVSLSSMARWNVTRHIPILPPQTAFIVAHTAPQNGVACLGATYDHRLLTGYDVVRVLEALATPRT
jgi:pyruvate/2-oxoglutarate dehydrogenase complex dihydrolipoamide acyltransferase (E2) component